MAQFERIGAVVEQRQGLEEENKKEESEDDKKGSEEGSEDGSRESQEEIEEGTPSSVSCQNSFLYCFEIYFVFYGI